MMAEPLVSVVIPVYNMELFLEEAVRSVLASSYPAIEVILMDDGSTDGSYALAQKLAAHPQVKAYTQANSGVCRARNHAISLASGKYILPVDADDLISENFIRDAVCILEADTQVKAVACRGRFFGAKNADWKLPEFSLPLLARKNMLPASCLFRRDDWVRVGGYCEEIIAREDWEFWISVLKDGGKVVRLPQIGLHYRVRNHSKRVSDRKLKRHVIEVLNRRHPEFFERELGGPLRYNRSWSRVINFFDRLVSPRKITIAPSFRAMASFIYSLPERFDKEGVSTYKGRNELKEFEVDGKKLIVKSYKIPSFFNRVVYSFFRLPKAVRAYRYACDFRVKGIGSPEPVGYYVTGRLFLMHRSFFVSVKSDCPYTYRDFAKRTFERRDEILDAIAKTTARMHECGYLHRDYSAGNILFDDDKPQITVEVIDLNRMSLRKVGLDAGCENFNRLPGSKDMLQRMAESYAVARGFDKQTCVDKIVNL